MTTEDSSGPSADPESGNQAENGKPDNLKVDTIVPPIPDGMSAQRVFKKASPNQKLILYLSSRDLVVSPVGIDKLQGVLLIDPEFVEDRKVYGQVTLTFRYGREDEEVMGLKFCNEAIMCLAQLYPPHSPATEGVSPLQEALIKRLGPNAYPFNMEITPLAPPSVQLVPAKEYNGAPIGTCYDVRAYVDKADEKLHRRSTVRMGIRVVQRAYAPPSPHQYVPGGTGRTCREKAKQNRKALLFGCRSAPLEVKQNENADPDKSRSAETVAHNESDRMEAEPDRIQSTEESSWTSEIEPKITKPTPEPLFQNANTLLVPPTNELQGHRQNQQRRRSSNEANGNIEDEDASSTRVSFDGRMTISLETSDAEHEEDEAREKCGKQEKRLSTAERGSNRDTEEDKTISDRYRSICSSKRPSLAAYLAGLPAPQAAAEKCYLLSDGRVSLTASLDKAIYAHGEEIKVAVRLRNDSSKTVKRIKAFVVQHVDVCMFSNGKFKNVVAMLNAKEDCPIHSGCSLEKTYSLTPIKSSTKNWIALEESYNKSGTSLASTVTSVANNPDDRNVFAIYVSYYVKIKLTVSVMGGEVSLKLPFTLMHTCSDQEHNMETLTRVVRTPDVRLDLQAAADIIERDTAKSAALAVAREKDTIKPEKDGT